jgi:uncharacterized protein
MKTENLLKKYGSWALITGASSGIGKCLADICCSDGLNVIILAEDKPGLEKAASELKKKYKQKVITCVCDLSKANHMKIIRQKTRNIDVDVLINCASFGTLGRFFDTPVETYISGIGISVTSYLTLTYEFLKGMRERNRGAVVFVCSVNAFSPVAFSSVYTAGKAFELYFGEALWRELKYADSKVDFLTMCASATKTNFQARAGTRVAKWAWTPEKAARTGLKALGKKPVVALSWRGNVFRYCGKLLPERLRLRFASWAITNNLVPDRPALFKKGPLS